MMLSMSLIFSPIFLIAVDDLQKNFLMRLANDLAVILKSQLKRVMGFQFFRKLADLFVLGTRVISRLFCVIDKYPFV